MLPVISGQTESRFAQIVNELRHLASLGVRYGSLTTNADGTKNLVLTIPVEEDVTRNVVITIPLGSEGSEILELAPDVIRGVTAAVNELRGLLNDATPEVEGVLNKLRHLSTLGLTDIVKLVNELEGIVGDVPAEAKALIDKIKHLLHL